MAPEQTQNLDHVQLAADVISAYVANNSVPASELPALITSVHASLVGLGQPGSTATAVETEIDKPTPAQIRKSITPDAIISFIDGKPYKTLKRHLGTHGLEPHSYRQRYGLPSDYPMVSPNYAEQRSALAKSIGLGRPGGMKERSESPANDETPAASGKGGRRKAAA